MLHRQGAFVEPPVDTAAGWALAEFVIESANSFCCSVMLGVP